ncbi:hypothetical protein EJ04DRAFT_508551 [Polyplosphaeria fusca]|uniref:Uncharacterized protein n=1 Tax=Polyplosphaeria fusca TaxID=682080 RepID=A0A9P4RA39_9PLEO|nr:hypothetical protein EJ04DRAFT_508551 [Polyplosphaeria fusca]
MSPSLNSSRDDPLHSKGANEQAKAMPPTLASTINALSILRIGFGAACLVAPRWTCALCTSLWAQLRAAIIKLTLCTNCCPIVVVSLPIPATSSILARFVGLREIVIGEVLFTAEDKTSPGGGRRELKRALWAGIAVDMLDFGSILYSFATGTMPPMTAAAWGGSAATMVLLARLCMRGL